MLINSQTSAVGVQEPRIQLLPADFDAGLSADRAADMIDVGAIAGVELDPWQRIGAEGITRTRSDGKWAAFEAFVAANRQQGKGTIIEVRQLAGLFVWEESLQVYTAHEFKTAQEMFLRIRTLIESTPVLDRLVSRIRTADGEEAIEAKNGCRLKFMARSNSSGRGFTADTIYLDEAMRLKQRMMAALMPTMSARTLTHNPQLLYFSSAGEVDSEVQEKVRERAVAGDSDRLAYIEWSVPRWAELPPDERARWRDEAEYRADPEVHRRGNPGWGIRLDPDYILHTELEQMGPEEFDRERLGIWAKLGGESVFPEAAWGNLADPDSTTGDRTVLVVEVAGNRESASVVAVSIRDDGKFHLEVVDNRGGTSWLAHRLKELRANGDIEAIYSIAGSHAESMVPEFKRAGVRVKLVRFAQYIKWCGLMFSKIVDGEVVHLDDPILNDAVDGVHQKWTQDRAGFYWSRKDSTVDITSLVAASVGVGVLDRRQSVPDGERRKAVIL